jgi:hypothetical protein
VQDTRRVDLVRAIIGAHDPAARLGLVEWLLAQTRDRISADELRARADPTSVRALSAAGLLVWEGEAYRIDAAQRLTAQLVWYAVRRPEVVALDTQTQLVALEHADGAPPSEQTLAGLITTVNATAERLGDDHEHVDADALQRATQAAREVLERLEADTAHTLLSQAVGAIADLGASVATLLGQRAIRSADLLPASGRLAPGRLRARARSLDPSLLAGMISAACAPHTVALPPTRRLAEALTATRVPAQRVPVAQAAPAPPMTRGTRRSDALGRVEQHLAERGELVGVVRSVDWREAAECYAAALRVHERLMQQGAEGLVPQHLVRDPSEQVACATDVRVAA